MDSSKREIRHIKIDPKKRRKTRFRKLAFWLLVDAIVAVVVFALLLHKPGSYDPAKFGSFDDEQRQVSPYLTHELLPKIHNDAQFEKPFDVVVTQDGISEIVIGLGWPKMSGGVMLYSPAVLFAPGSVVLMGTASLKGAEFVVTFVIRPEIDEQGRLNLLVSKVKVGAMNVTPLAKMMAKKMYAQRIAALPDGMIDSNAWETKIAGSLLSGEPFEPVFKIDDRKLRIEQITVQNQKLTARLIPVL